MAVAFSYSFKFVSWLDIFDPNHLSLASFHAYSYDSRPSFSNSAATEVSKFSVSKVKTDYNLLPGVSLDCSAATTVFKD